MMHRNINRWVEGEESGRGHIQESGQFEINREQMALFLFISLEERKKNHSY